MRPDRRIVQQAIRDENGNLSRVAVRLGCSRQTLYTWIYQLGLEKLAGIRIDTRDGLDKRMRKDTQDTRLEKPFKTGVYSAPSDASTLSPVAPTATAEQTIPATVKLPESLWKRIRTKAIWQNRTVGEVVREALEESLAAESGGPSKNGKKNGGRE